MKRAGFVIPVLAAVVILPTLAPTRLSAQDSGPVAGLTRVVNGKKVGPETFTLLEDRSIQNACGTRYHQVDAALSGSIDGYTVKTGTRVELFVDDPEIQLAQRLNHEERFHGIGRYSAEGDKKSGMTIFFPDSSKDWNGKLYVIVTGSALYAEVGELIPRTCGQFTPYTSQNLGHVGLLIDKGYAVVHTRRAALNPRTVYQARDETIAKAFPVLDERDRVRMEKVTLDDGTVLDGKAYNFHAGLMRDYTLVAKNFLKSRLGRRPDRTYFYGHSSGSSLGSVINLVPSVNLDADGKAVFDGLLLDDPAAGLFWPTKYVNGEDVLFRTEAERRQFVPEFDIAHAAYIGDEFIGGSYLANKRERQRILNAKGLGGRSRIYEVLGVSHHDAGRQKEADYRANNLDLAPVFDAIIDRLDDWVDRGIEPPPSRSDSYQLGDLDHDGRNEHPAIALPAIACPTGVYYNFPKGQKSSATTAFEPYLKDAKHVINATTEVLPDGFDAKWLEPIDEFGYLVDMNGSRVRDTKESISQAWQRRARDGYRSGILKSGEVLTHEKYVACVATVATDLYRQGVVSGSAMTYYIEQAIRSEIGK